MSDLIKIGTRDSQLAKWQADKVASKLRELNFETEIVFIKSEGDLDLETPLSEMGGKGVFTKALDTALINGDIDIAVHSYKDLPTDNDLPLTIPAILEREDPRDALVSIGVEDDDLTEKELTIATGSLRRKSQWLYKYKNHNIVDLRGNVNTRLKKIETNKWDGAIFAAAGLKRINLDSRITHYLDWMVPAPAQGAIATMVSCDRTELIKTVSKLDHSPTSICTGVERELLNVMEAGCSAPVGAYARIIDNTLHFKAIAIMPDSSEKFEIEEEIPTKKHKGFGAFIAKKLLDSGADKVIDSIKDN